MSDVDVGWSSDVDIGANRLQVRMSDSDVRGNCVAVIRYGILDRRPYFFLSGSVRIRIRI